MAEGGYNSSATTQSSDRRENETPDVKKKKKNHIHGVQKKWKRRKHGSRSTGDIASGGNDQTASTGSNGDCEDEHKKISQTWADLVPIVNLLPPHSQLNKPVHDYKDNIKQRTQFSQPLHVQGQLKPLAETEDYSCLDVIHNQVSGICLHKLSKFMCELA